MAQPAGADAACVLTTEAHERAITFIRDNANGLQQAELDWYLSGDGSGVEPALAAYQNPDGGFGHGLEADLRTERSSVLATTIALQTLSRLGATADAPLVAGAMRYLTEARDDANRCLIDASCNDTPHAPWWTWDASAAARDGFVPNPGAEILSYLYTWPGSAPDAMRDDLCNRAVTHLEGAIQMHDLLCYLRLLENPALPPDVADALLPPLLERAFELVIVDPAEWSGYVLKPFDTVTGPDSPLARFLGEALDTSIAWEIDRQAEDGGWYPHWTWGDSYPATWKVVRVGIAVELTLKMLGKLRALGAVGNT